METNAIKSPKAVSLAEVVSDVKAAYKDDKDLAPFAEMLWQCIYEQIPCLDYSTEEKPDEENCSPEGYAAAKGNPDICAALKDCLVRAGMPDCTATLRVVLPAFWFVSRQGVLETCQMRKNKGYLWALDREKHNNARSAYGAEFEAQKPYILSNLVIALGSKQNL
ncbi:MAG: hypothetical protein QXM31_01305 [Candidatus Woesearchaeota archaeon]